MDKPIINKLPKAGDICDLCRKFWEHQKLAPRRLVHVFDDEGFPITTDRGTEIIICPHCDGDAILKLPKSEG